MQRRTYAIAGAALLAGLLSCGCGRKPPETADGASALPQTTSPPTNPGSAQAASNTPVKDAVESLLQQDSLKEYPTFPKGTRLLSADLQEGVVTLDLSQEFNLLTKMGESSESKAQKELREALWNIPGVEKMRVTVEGRPFESEATDWNTPFPVRYVGDVSSPNGRGAPAPGERPGEKR